MTSCWPYDATESRARGPECVHTRALLLPIHSPALTASSLSEVPRIVAGMDKSRRSTAKSRRSNAAKAAEVAAGQGGIVTRAQLHALGMSSAAIKANVDARRWQEVGVHCLSLTTGPLGEDARLWAAVLEAGPRAYLDGDTALVRAGLRNYVTAKIRVTVPRGARVRHRGSAVDIRQTRRWDPDATVPGDVPRARVPGAAVRAALWARSDRQALVLITMVVQQKLATVAEVAADLLKVKRDKRRSMLATLLLDLAGGVGSLGELDVLRGCRERGIPEPDSQVMRRTPNGTIYLDFRWRQFGVTVEVDGVQHGWVENAIGDALRHNFVAVEGDVVLRLPVLGLKVCPDDFFEQIEQALASRGWRGRASLSA